MELILATTNINKLREFKDLFKTLLPHIELISLRQFPNYTPPEETGKTIKENAILKAEHAAQFFGKWVLADDTGLIIPILGGEPGVYSARYAGKNATVKENCEKVLEKLKSYTSNEERAAHFESCLALANKNGLVKVVEGLCEGYITEEPRGRTNFGYQPIFVKHDYQKTFGELDESVVNRISHRRKAFDKLVLFLEKLRD